MVDCIFCKIIAGDIPCNKINENENFIAFLDIEPINKGHSLVVPKKHFVDFNEFPEELGNDYIKFIKETMNLLKKLNPDGINIGANNGEAAGQVVMHQHTHLIPRWKTDGLQAWPGKKSEELDQLCDLINS